MLVLLAHLPMSLCNHELSVVCRHWRCCWHWCCHLWTVLLATGLITETSYLGHLCTYVPSTCMWIIKPIQRVFFKWQPFYLISLCGSHDNMVKLRAFIFGSCMHMYRDYTHKLCSCGEDSESDNFLKFHILHFFSHAQCT